MSSYTKKMMYIITVAFVSSILLLPFKNLATDSDRLDTLILLGNEDLLSIYIMITEHQRCCSDIAKAIGEKINKDLKF